ELAKHLVGTVEAHPEGSGRRPGAAGRRLDRKPLDPEERDRLALLAGEAAKRLLELRLQVAVALRRPLGRGGDEHPPLPAPASPRCAARPSPRRSAPRAKATGSTR